MNIKDYIDNKFKLNQITDVSYYEGRRKNKDKIYLVKDGKEYEVESQIITKGVNSKGQGIIIAINHNGALYIEHQEYFGGLERFLDSLKEFCETIVTKPIAVTAQGPAPASPELITKAQILINNIDILKKELP